MGDIIRYKRRTIYEGGGTMCAPMEKIQNKTALQLLNEFGNSNKSPVDLKELLSNIGISVLPMDFSKLNEKANGKRILGLVMSNHDNAVIYYDKNDSPESQRFTIAHELAHISQHLEDQDLNDCIYIDFRTGGSTKDEKEVNANIFAGELLIPLHKLRDVYMNIDYPTSITLARFFGVSVKTMEARLDYLGVNYYNKDGKPVVNA